MRYLNPCAKTIGWADYTWNPVTGCENNCEYCYARRMANRFHQDFKPAFHPERLDAPLRLTKPSRIFVCSNADLFGDWVPAEWIESVLKVCAENPWHRFLFLTKNPKRYSEFYFPSFNCWIGTSITGLGNFRNISLLMNADCRNRFISYEPILESLKRSAFEVTTHQYVSISKIDYDNLKKISWIIAGAQTPYWAGSFPSEEAICQILLFAKEYKIPLFLKDSLYLTNPLKQFPEGLKLRGAETDVSAAGRPDGQPSGGAED